MGRPSFCVPERRAPLARRGTSRAPNGAHVGLLQTSNARIGFAHSENCADAQRRDDHHELPTRPGPAMTVWLVWSCRHRRRTALSGAVIRQDVDCRIAANSADARRIAATGQIHPARRRQATLPPATPRASRQARATPPCRTSTRPSARPRRRAARRARSGAPTWRA